VLPTTRQCPVQPRDALGVAQVSQRRALTSRQPILPALLQHLSLLFVFCALTIRGQIVSREYQLKAVFLYRFTQFIDWPAAAFPTPQTPITIGILGPDPFGSYLEASIRDEKVHNRPLSVQHYQSVQYATNCHVLFISSSEGTRLSKVLGALKGRSILTVGETEDFAFRGGMIQFITERNRIRFRINLQASRAAGFQMSSKLLDLAEIVSAKQD
jgi:hypothetical protein